MSKEKRMLVAGVFLGAVGEGLWLAGEKSWASAMLMGWGCTLWALVWLGRTRR